MITPVRGDDLQGPHVHVHHQTPPAAVLLKKEAGIEKGSPTSNRQKVGKVTRAQLRKMPSSRCRT